jgi:DNA topoisomerase VI subunit B
VKTKKAPARYCEGRGLKAEFKNTPALYSASAFQPQILEFQTEHLARRFGATFHQGETAMTGAQFLQVENTKPLKQRPKLTRVPFEVSRLMEFCSQRELTNQTGHDIEDWPLVILKELVDNALDSCEEAGVAPVITISVSTQTGTIVIEDNGPGISGQTIRGICDYNIRVSSREAYVSPTRGAQGNALKTILAMAFVVDQAGRRDVDPGDAVGRTVIEAGGIVHTIEFTVDHVTNEPVIAHTTAPSSIAVGTRISIRWPSSGEYLFHEAEDSFKQLAESYVWFNPHLSMRGAWNGVAFVDVETTNPNWTKWRPSDPTSPHWYSQARLQRYLSAHVARDLHLGQDRPVREFIAEFRGLSGSGKQKQILADIGASRQSLREFYGRTRVNRTGIADLLDAMKRHSKPVPPKLLGVIGETHLKACILAAGGAQETFKYTRQTGFHADVPYVVECAFAVHEHGLLDGGFRRQRRLITGANWSVGISNPFRRFGKTGEGLETVLAKGG